MWIKYTTRDTPYTLAQNITLDKYSNGLSVHNVGNSVCTFNSDPLQPGESKTIGGNKLEILDGRYKISFRPIDNPPVGYVQQDLAIVTEKYYMPKPGQELQSTC